MDMMHARTADKTIGRWPGILQSLGIDPQFLRNKHGPCPACRGVDRYRFDDKDGRGTWFCSHCGAGDGFTLLKNVFGWGFREACEHVERIIDSVQVHAVAPGRTEESKIQALHMVWNDSRLVTRGDPVWLYLNRRVGIVTVPSDLRFHPGLPYIDDDRQYLGKFPAMVAKIRYPDGSGASIHRTYLTEVGDKAPVPQSKKTMPGKPLPRASVRLSDVQEYVGIAEGIETALAASIQFGVPAWAATNATLLEAWVPPKGVKRVLIAADNDASYTGQAAAFALACRLKRDRYAVDVQIPDMVDTDWADLLRDPRMT